MVLQVMCDKSREEMFLGNMKFKNIAVGFTVMCYFRFCLVVMSMQIEMN